MSVGLTQGRPLTAPPVLLQQPSPLHTLALQVASLVGFAGQDVAGRLAAARVIGQAVGSHRSKVGCESQSPPAAEFLKRRALRFCGALWRCAEPSSATAAFCEGRSTSLPCLLLRLSQPVSSQRRPCLLSTRSLTCRVGLGASPQKPRRALPGRSFTWVGLQRDGGRAGRGARWAGGVAAGSDRRFEQATHDDRNKRRQQPARRAKVALICGGTCCERLLPQFAAPCSNIWA